jgi:hypothetical protein
MLSVAVGEGENERHLRLLQDGDYEGHRGLCAVPAA